MSLEENKNLVRRGFAAISHDGDLSVLDDLYTTDYAHIVGGEPHSSAWLKDIVMQFRAGFPDVRFAIEDLAAEGDRVWVRWTLHGTHLGEFMGNPPTGKVIRIEDNFNIVRVANGKLAGDTVHWRRGFLEIFEQIGGIPPD